MDKESELLMNLIQKKLLTIITESTLEPILIKELKTMGLKGYSIMESHGEGSRGLRNGEWDQNRNITIQIVCKAELAYPMLDYVVNHYYEDYALIAFVTDVEVCRAEKF
jgi:nitrogen regulatory protein PII